VPSGWNVATRCHSEGAPDAMPNDAQGRGRDRRIGLPAHRALPRAEPGGFAHGRDPAPRQPDSSAGAFPHRASIVLRDTRMTVRERLRRRKTASARTRPCCRSERGAGRIRPVTDGADRRIWLRRCTHSAVPRPRPDPCTGEYRTRRDQILRSRHASRPTRPCAARHTRMTSRAGNGGSSCGVRRTEPSLPVILNSDSTGGQKNPCPGPLDASSGGRFHHPASPLSNSRSLVRRMIRER
jgi:hypothetical protein